MGKEFRSHQVSPGKPVKAKPAASSPLAADRKPHAAAAAGAAKKPEKPTEIGGPKGPEPTRYGDWEKNGICYDF